MPPTDIESAWPKYPGYAITSRPFDGIGRASFGGVVIAESSACLVVAESDHLDQLYFPIDAVAWDRLVSSETSTVCPFKGRASYWSVVVGDETCVDGAWSYAAPFDEVSDIAGYVAFYTDRFSVTVTETWDDDPTSSVTYRFPMWGSADALLGLMDVMPLGDGRFIAPPYPNPPLGTFFEQAKRLRPRDVIEGGQLLGDIIVAASKSDPTKRLTSAYATFLKAASFDAPIDISLDVLRAGRSVTTVEARLSQSGSLRCAGMAMLDAGGDDVLRLAEQMPDVGPPQVSPLLDMSVLGRELREVDGSYLARRDVLGPALVQVWARFRHAPPQQYLHQAAVAQMTTHWTIAAALRPHLGITEADAHLTVSTGPLTVSIAFHDEIDITQWMLYVNPAIYAGGGSVQGDGRVYSIDGRLLASYTVQAMVRSFVAPAESFGGKQRAM
jgi:acyl-CoA thioesterase II